MLSICDGPEDQEDHIILFPAIKDSQTHVFTLNVSIISRYCLKLSFIHIKCRLANINPRLADIHWLKELHLVGQHLPSFDVIFMWPNLEILDLSWTGIRKLSLGIGRLKVLRTLYLVDNLLTSLPLELAEIELRNLNIADNPFPEFPPVLDEMVGLETLIMRLNNQSFNIGDGFTDLNLKRLSLINCGLVSLPCTFGVFPFLTRLDLQDHNFNHFT